MKVARELPGDRLDRGLWNWTEPEGAKYP